MTVPAQFKVRRFDTWSFPNPAGKAKPQLVLLDHGLYRSLDNNLRSNYAALWKVGYDLDHWSAFLSKEWTLAR